MQKKAAVQMHDDRMQNPVKLCPSYSAGQSVMLMYYVAKLML